MSYRDQIRYKQMREARIYGGNYGAYTEDGKSWLQQQVAADPNFVKESDQSQWGRDAYYYWKDQERGGQLPSVRDLPMPGVRVSPSQMPSQFAKGDYGLLVKSNPQLQSPQVVKPQYQTVWLNGDPLAQAQQKQDQPATFATADQVRSGQAAWGDMTVADRKAMLKDPNFYQNANITKFAPAVQQEILKDPNFDWDKVAVDTPFGKVNLQKMYYELSSSPAGMGAAQGALMGAIGGSKAGAVGAALGAGLGAVGGWAGYDQTKEAWQQGDNQFTWDAEQLKDVAKGAFGWLNFAAEQAEKTIGLGVQAIDAAQDPNLELKDVLTKEAWNAGASTFEAMTPAVLESMRQYGLLDNLLSGKVPTTEELKRGGLNMVLWGIPQAVDLFTNPEKYKGTEYYLGAANALKLEQTYYEKLAEARDRISKGENYRQVMTDMQTGITAQMGDMLGQAIADPLNVVGSVESRVGEGISKVTGNKVAEAAFTGTTGLTEAKGKYRTLVQTGEALKIDPNFKTTEMNWLSRQIAGVNKEGQIKAGGWTSAGLLDAVKGEAEARPSLWKDPRGFVKMLTSETPQSRAETGAVLFKDNVVAMLSSFDDPHEAITYLKALSNNDMDTWRQMGGRFAESPEFYTVLPALKDFNSSKLEGIIQAWDMTQVNRDYLTKIADITGDSPARLLDDLAKRGTAEQDFARITERLRTSTDPQAKAMLAEIDAGKFTVKTLADVVDVFTGEGALPYHPAQWKAMMGAELSDHFGNWAAERLALDKSPEAKSAFFRTMGVLKTAQSILLLGGSPGYAITNGLSGMVHLAASGIYGFMSPKQIGSFLDRLGVSPARLEEGVGIGGERISSQLDGGSAIREAVKGEGTLTDIKQKMGKISSGMPFSKLSGWFEKMNGAQAFGQGMKQMWSQSWRRGVGFSEMRPELVGTLREMGVNPSHIYAAIEAGMNQGEIEKALFGRYEGVQARSLVNDAAVKSGLSASQAAEMLEKLGVLDQLDSYLKGQTTADGINAAFEKASRVARDQMDIRTGEDLAHMADSVKQKVGLEGGSAALDVVQKAHGAFTDVWMDHYFRFGDLFENLKDIPDEKMKNKAFEQAYRQSDDEFRRMYARNGANYKGIFDAWGMSGDENALGVLRAIGESDAAMKGAYDTMRQLRGDHFATDWGGDIDAMFNNWDKVNKQIDDAFKIGFDQKHRADVKMGEGLAKIYEGKYGPAAGEAARAWWEDVVKLGDEITAKERKARNQFASMPKEQREIAKKKYYGETKVMQIAELEKINNEGIARLERVIKGGGGSPESGSPLSPSPEPTGSFDTGRESAVPTQPPSTDVKPTPAQEVAEFTAKAEARVEAEKVEKAARLESVLGVAAEFTDRNGKVYDLENKYALMGALRKYGDESILGLDDPRVTAEFVRDALGKQKTAHEAQAAEAAQVVQKDIITKPRSELDPKLSEALNMEAKRIADVVSGGEAGQRLFAEGQFIGATSSTYPDWYNDLQRQTGGKKKLVAALEKIQKDHGADKGVVVERVKEFLANNLQYGDPATGSPPNLKALQLMGADDATMVNALEIFNDQFNTAFTMEQVLNDNYAQGVEFDAQAWEESVFKTLANDDLTALYEAVGELPPEMLDRTIVPEGETYRAFVERTMAEMEKRVEIANRDEGIASHMTEAEQAITKQETHAEAVTTRQLMKEKFMDAFGLDEAQADAYMQMSNSLADWYAKTTGGDADSFYKDYYADVVKGDEADYIDGLKQAYGRIEVAERKMTAVDAENYARMLVRGGEGELTRAIRNEPNKADRIAILDAAHNLDADMAQSVAKGQLDLLLQGTGGFDTTRKGGGSTQPSMKGAKGAVVFEGMKATIHAFEARDFTTLVHENGHVFRRMLKDVAERTGNKQIMRDLATVEAWAGVKDGVWKVEHEEKFARGFEEYVATGKAPLPKLKAAFEMMKTWMMDVYKSITGSDIDVKVSEDVRGVFDRMLGAEAQKQLAIQEMLAGGEINQRQPARAQLRDAWGKLDNVDRDEAINWILQKTMTDPLSGMETLVAKEMSAKPAGWIDATTDLNALKAINDTWGHEAGDVVIKQLGGVAKEEAAKVGGRAFRVGGDEMSYWFPDEQSARKALTAIDENFQKLAFEVGGERRSGFSVSYGLGENFEAADAMLYQDKERRVPLGQRAERGKIPESIKSDPLFQRNLEKVKGGQENTLFQRAEPVDTPAFKNWFGESKVIDENGKPLVVYHGTRKEFTEFKGVSFFADHADYAGEMATGGFYTATNAMTLPVYLQISKPLEVTLTSHQFSDPTYETPYIQRAKAEGYDGVVFKDAGGEDTFYVTFKPEQVKSVNNRGTFDPNNPNILFQREPVNMAGEQPFGSLDAAVGDNGLFHGEVMDEGWRTQVQPLMDAMREGALESLNNKPLDGAVRDMNPEGQKMLRQYMKQVQNEMASTKLATMRWGENKRDEAMLNYGKRYGIDRYMEAVYPYQFFYTRSMGGWAARALDRPAWFANYARIKRQQDRYERDIPERLRGKIKISMPWMPDWMGDAMYIDPLSNLFTPANYLKPFERMTKDSTMQQQEAERILQEWSANGQTSQTELATALQTRSGTTWERALAEAQIRRQSEIANPMDFFNTMFGPAWYLTTPMKLLNGEATGVTSTPLLNTTRAIDTVTQGTWAEGVGNVIGMIGRPEQWLQKKLGVPEFGEYGDYYIDRQLANMTAEGLITPEDAQMAMIERNGANFEQARERVKMELAMKVPTMAALMAGLTADNFAQGVGRMAMTSVPSLFGSGLLPEGEIEFRGLKQEWNEAWKKADGGDKTAIPEFFDEHPEYQAYLAKGKPPEERLRSFLVGQIWDGYMELGLTNQKQARKEMGELFSQAFLDKETRSYETLTVEQLTQWARMFGRKAPTTPQTQQVMSQPAPELPLYDESVTRLTDKYFKDRTEKFPNYYQLEQGYYNLPKSDRTKYLLTNPELKQYWKWKDAWSETHPELVPIFKGQVFKTVDTTGWNPYLVESVADYAMTGKKLGKGAWMALEQQWIMAGQPYGDMKTWLNSQVAPALMYGGAQ